MSDETGATASASSAAAPSAAPSSASPDPAASASAPATAAPATGVAPDLSGEPPKERWADILDNTRKKTRSEVEAEIRQQYGWADSFQSDPLAFLDQHLATHPQYGAQLTAWAARHLGARRGQTAPAAVERPKPDVPIVDAQGNVTGYTYSDKQQDALDEWRWSQREAALNEKFAPLETMRTQIEQAQQRAQLEHQSSEFAKTTLETLRQNPYFKDHEAKIKQTLLEHEEFGDNVYAAFVHVLSTDVLPALSQTEQRKVLDSLQQKAAASTVNPQGGVPSQKPKFTSFGEASRYYAEHPEEAEAMANR